MGGISCSGSLTLGGVYKGKNPAHVFWAPLQWRVTISLSVTRFSLSPYFTYAYCLDAILIMTITSVKYI